MDIIPVLVVDKTMRCDKRYMNRPAAADNFLESRHPVCDFAMFVLVNGVFAF